VPDVDATLAALADPYRRAVVGLLRRGPLRPSEVANALSLSRPATSRHLTVLRRAGIVTGESLESDARVRLYTLRLERLRELRAWLQELEDFWTDQLRAFQAHAERKPRGRRR
jgi:DNA-binding transcriptional ArsR family regulator